MKEDAAIKEIRDTRAKISAEFDNSPVKLVEHYIKLQKRYRYKTSEPSTTLPILSEKSAEYAAKTKKTREKEPSGAVDIMQH